MWENHLIMSYFSSDLTCSGHNIWNANPTKQKKVFLLSYCVVGGIMPMANRNIFRPFLYKLWMVMVQLIHYSPVITHGHFLPKSHNAHPIPCPCKGKVWGVYCEFKVHSMFHFLICSTGVGVTKAPFVNFPVSKICDLAKISVRFFESHSYLTGVTSWTVTTPFKYKRACSG